MKGKKSFVLYSDQKELFEQLPDDVAGKLIKHIFMYVNDEYPSTDDVLVNVAFTAIKSSLKRDLEKWEKQIEQRRQAGKKSAESRQRNSTTVNDRQRNSTDSVNVNVSVNDNVNEIKKNKEDKPSPPTYDEFLAYALEKKPKANRQEIKLKYEAWMEAGWKKSNGKGGYVPIINWKSTLLQTLPYIKEVAASEAPKFNIIKRPENN